jgi:hypothetical protein
MLAFRDKILRHLPGLSLNLLGKFDDWPSTVREIAGTNLQAYSLSHIQYITTRNFTRVKTSHFVLASDVVSDIRLKILIGIRQFE